MPSFPTSRNQSRPFSSWTELIEEERGHALLPYHEEIKVGRFSLWTSLIEEGRRGPPFVTEYFTAAFSSMILTSPSPVSKPNRRNYFAQ